MEESQDIERNMDENQEMGRPDRDLKHYLPLYKAATKGDWGAILDFQKSDPQALTAPITKFSETTLHVAVRNGSIKVICNLVASMSADSLAIEDGHGETPLHCAGIVGNAEAAKILCQKNATLPQILNRLDETPLHCAARFGHKEAVFFLLQATDGAQYPFPYAGELGATLLNHLINADFNDIALNLLKRYPSLAAAHDPDGSTALLTLAQRPQAFESGNKVGFLQRLLYKVIPVRRDEALRGGDMENMIGKAKIGGILDNLFGFPRQKYDDEDSLQSQALELAKRLCEGAIGCSEAENILKPTILKAAILGIQQLVREIINAFPDSIWFCDEDRRNIFHLAILHRREKVFNLLYQMSLEKHYVLQLPDRKGNNILHLAAYLGPENSTLGPALQMQRDLQWFREVERLVQPSHKKMKNRDGMTPEEMFTREHKELAREGQGWITQVASSYAFVALLQWYLQLLSPCQAATTMTGFQISYTSYLS